MANHPKLKTGKSILLERVPEDIQKILIEKTAVESEHCKCHRPQDYSLYKILREWDHIVCASKGSLVLMVDGQSINLQDVEINFFGSSVVLIAKFPITSNVGAVLNFNRISDGE